MRGREAEDGAAGPLQIAGVGHEHRPALRIDGDVVEEQRRDRELVALGEHDLDALPRKKSDGGIVDARIEHGLGTAAQERDTTARNLRR